MTAFFTQIDTKFQALVAWNMNRQITTGPYPVTSQWEIMGAGDSYNCPGQYKRTDISNPPNGKDAVPPSPHPNIEKVTEFMLENYVQKVCLSYNTKYIQHHTELNDHKIEFLR